MPDGATRRVSLHEPDARPIARGRLGKPVEFEYNPQLTGDDDGIITDYAVEQGNPADGPQLAPAVQRVIKRAGKAPRTVTADRSYGEKAIEDDVYGLVVRHVLIPRKGKPGKARQAAERRPAFRRTVKWRTGSEGRISTLKTAIRVGPHPPGRHQRSPDLGRARGPRPQPGQDQELLPGRSGRSGLSKGGRRGIWAFSCRPSAAVRRRRTGSILAASVVPRRRKAAHRHA
jgi:IS5 family transposase